MRQNVWRWLCGAGVVAAAGAVAGSQGVASATPSGSVGSASTSSTVAIASSTVASASSSFVSRTSVTAATAYKPPSRPLHFGQSGPAVRSVQSRLKQLHYFPGPIDGKYGQDLIEAAWAFREVQGLPMNNTTGAEPITRTFERDLVNPRAPYVLIKRGPATRIEINLKRQVLVLYKKNQVSLIAHVSSGGGYYFCNPHGGSCGYAVTPDGNFKALSFQSGWIKVPLGTMYNPIWFDYADGDAIHGDIPAPWYPASHGCVRVWMDIAGFLHNEITIGGRHATPVYIRGKAPYILGPG